MPQPTTPQTPAEKPKPKQPSMPLGDDLPVAEELPEEQPKPAAVPVTSPAPAARPEHPAWLRRMAKQAGFTDAELSEYTSDEIGQMLTSVRQQAAAPSPPPPAAEKPSDKFDDELENELSMSPALKKKLQALDKVKGELEARLAEADNANKARLRREVNAMWDAAFAALPDDLRAAYGEKDCDELNDGEPEAVCRMALISVAAPQIGDRPLTQRLLNRLVRDAAGKLKFAAPAAAAPTSQPAPANPPPAKAPQPRDPVSQQFVAAEDVEEVAARKAAFREGALPEPSRRDTKPAKGRQLALQVAEAGLKKLRDIERERAGGDDDGV